MIKDYAWIGVGAALIQQIEIGQNSIVGAGSCVFKEFAENVTVAGVPARIIRKSYADEKMRPHRIGLHLRKKKPML